MQPRRRPQRINDYRLNIIPREKNRVSFVPRVPVVLVGFNLFDDISFRLPSMTAMLLDQSYISWEESKYFLKDEFFTKLMNFHEERGKLYILKHKSEHSLFDAIQKKMIAVVFAYTALESFANESIPETFIFKKERDDKKCIEVYKKEQAEFLSLDLKLSEVLPQIFNINSPRGTRIWERYAFIKKLRDRIIHTKTKDRVTTKFAVDTIWSNLLDDTYTNIAIEAKSIIGYYLENSPSKPRWFIRFPW